MGNSRDITGLLNKVNEGDRQAFDQLVSEVYGELHRMAASFMRSQRQGHTLQPTALVNEAWLGLAASGTQWDGKAHFFGAAARAMRQVLVAHARQKAAKKRSGDVLRVTFRDLQVQAAEPDLDLLLLDEALDALAKADERLSDVMQLRYFAGCDLGEIAVLTGRSLATVKRDWAYARAWLYEYMSR